MEIECRVKLQVDNLCTCAQSHGEVLLRSPALESKGYSSPLGEAKAA